jgi:hypothetical protein
LLSLIIIRSDRVGPINPWGLAAWSIFVGGLCGAIAVATRRWLEGRVGD